MNTVIRTVLVTAASPFLTGAHWLPGGAFEFMFTGSTNATFSVWSSPDLAVPPANWTLAGTASNAGGAAFLFTDPQASKNAQRFYRVSSP